MLESVNLDTFAGHEGESFRLQVGESQSMDVELMVARSLGGAPKEGMREPFSIEFRGPLEPVLPQASYTLAHEKIGPFEIFLVPVGPDDENVGMLYEAVFN